MASPPRYLPRGKVHFVTTRAEEGLPFVCTLYMQLIIQSALARAQHLYPITICGFCMMGNHLHMIIVVHEATDVEGFIDRVKTELSHAINRLLGRRRRTVWCAGYDAPPILTLEDVVDKFIYLYTNPQQARLVSSIDTYPGFSTWKMFLSREESIDAPWIHRPFIKPLHAPALTEQEDKALATELVSKCTESFPLTLSPSAWLECFNIPEEQAEEMRQRIIDGVRAFEKEQQAQGATFLGAENLREQPIDIPYTPQKFSKRMWCICRDVALRSEFIAGVKKLIARAKDVYERWKKGDFSVEYPKELFAPRFPKRRCSGLSTAPA